MSGAMEPVRRSLRDERGFVVGFLVRTALIFGLVGLVLFESGQILMTAIRTSGVAGTAAQAAANAYYRTHSYGEAKQAAIRAARSDDPSAKVVSVQIAKDGSSATVTVVEVANTVVVHRIGFLKHFGVLHSTEQETPATV